MTRRKIDMINDYECSVKEKKYDRITKKSKGKI